ncbi:MAG: hypothetical protein ACPGOY_12170 [Rhodospirillaceae bacterium]
MIESVVQTAQRLIGEGRDVDLNALEAKVSKAMGAVLSLPEDQRRPMIPRLEGLISLLDTLEAAVKDRLETLSTLLGGPGADAELNTPEGPGAPAAKAAKAYAKLSPSAPRPSNMPPTDTPNPNAGPSARAKQVDRDKGSDSQ